MSVNRFSDFPWKCACGAVNTGSAMNESEGNRLLFCDKCHKQSVVSAKAIVTFNWTVHVAAIGEPIEQNFNVPGVFRS